MCNTANNDYPIGPFNYEYVLASPPDPRIPNRNLEKDYIDWYFKHYMTEERMMRWVIS